MASEKDAPVSTEKAANKDDEKEFKFNANVKIGNKGVIPQRSHSSHIALFMSRLGPKFDIKASIGGGHWHKELKAIPKRFDLDPEWFVENMAGIWKGNKGVDRVFVVPTKKIAKGGGSWETGFESTYEETMVCARLPGWTLNPKATTPDEPAGMFVGAEMIFALRYHKSIVSTQINSDGSDNPFERQDPPQALHDEIGYIQFCYCGKEDPKNKDGVLFELKRITTSFTLPRTVIVNSNCEIHPLFGHAPTIDQSEGVLNYVSTAGILANKNIISYPVISGKHFHGLSPLPGKKKHAGSGLVTNVTTKNKIKFGADGSATWEYKQESPFFFPAPVNWEHDNSNTLTKVSFAL